MFVQARGNSSPDNSNSSRSGGKWSDAGNGWKASAFSCVGRVTRERGAHGASCGSGPLPHRDRAAISWDAEVGAGGWGGWGGR